MKVGRRRTKLSKKRIEQLKGNLLRGTVILPSEAGKISSGFYDKAGVIRQRLSKAVREDPDAHFDRRKRVFAEADRFADDFGHPTTSVKVSFDLGKIAETRRFLQTLSKANREDSHVASLLLETLANGKTRFIKSHRVFFVSPSIWKQMERVDPWIAGSPAHIWMRCILIRSDVPQRFQRTIINHEIREAILKRAGYSKQVAHGVARKKESRDAPKGFYEWLKKKYPKAKLGIRIT